MKLIPFSQIKEEWLKDPELKRLYEESAAEYELMASLIEKRLAKGLTQSALAKKVGTKQSAIARLESGRYNPSLAFLRKVATALDTKLVVSMKS